MILTRDELRGWSPLELATLAVWNEEKGGATARQANLAIEELERRAAERDRYRDALQSAMDELGPGHDEVSDSPANCCFAVLLDALNGEAA